MQACCPLAGPADDDGGDGRDDNGDNEDNEYDEEDDAGKQRIRRTLSSASCKVQLHVSVLMDSLMVAGLQVSLLSLD